MSQLIFTILLFVLPSLQAKGVITRNRNFGDQHILLDLLLLDKTDMSTI